MTLYDDMPHGIEVGGGGFIPPPPGASQGGQPYNPSPGTSAAQSSSTWLPAPAPAPAPTAPRSANAARTQAPPWLSGPSWAYVHYPPFRPQSGWSAPTPAGSWGDATPAGSWGSATPASASASANAYAYYSPWVNSQPGVGAQESTFGQPITASLWFNGGGVTLGAASPGFGGDTQGQGQGGGEALALVRKNSRHSHRHPHPAQNEYPNLMRSSADHVSQGSSRRPRLPPAPHDVPRRHRDAQSQVQRKPAAVLAVPTDAGRAVQNLARRRRDWRPDYDPRAGLASYIPRVSRPRSDFIEWHEPMKRTQHRYIAYKPH
ncbi:hypothetical protein LshimejAT787_2600040 [Lyophyllum shimeji]|uniref:Uncharacterized protein n=1 Tax=Lyophyllum shimeji TaxID=47721 RepID=A0A9P3UX09_LYOSH|nr:hypothetical protein LshimejAT787_2600040 [Lyophyllum shimeji]